MSDLMAPAGEFPPAVDMLSPHDRKPRWAETQIDALTEMVEGLEAKVEALVIRIDRLEQRS
jgi:hypothetical protein